VDFDRDRNNLQSLNEICRKSEPTYMKSGKYKSYGLGRGGQTGFSGSVVLAGRSRRAWR